MAYSWQQRHAEGPYLQVQVTLEPHKAILDALEMALFLQVGLEPHHLQVYLGECLSLPLILQVQNLLELPGEIPWFKDVLVVKTRQ